MRKKGAGITDFDIGDIFEKTKAEMPVKKPARAQVPAVALTEKVKPIGVVYRMKPSDWKKLKELGIAKRVSLQDILELSVDQYLRGLGLASIEGFNLEKLRIRNVS